MRKIVKTIKTEIIKTIIYSNGFTGEYVMDEKGNLKSYYFKKDGLIYHKVFDLEQLQRILPGQIHMQSTMEEYLFPKYKVEEELLKLEKQDFENLYHLYFSDNSIIIDKNGNKLSTCVQFDAHFVKVWGFKDFSVSKFCKIIREHTLYSKIIKDGTEIVSINFLLKDEDFKLLTDKVGNKIHENEAMFYLRDLFIDKVTNTLTKDIK